MKVKYSERHKISAIEEYKRIKSAQKVSDILGIAPTTVRSWIRQFRISQNLVPPSAREENLKQLKIQMERIAKESTTDINVNILGCPPPGRSALDRKLEIERKKQNDTRQRHPFSICNYYRETRD